MEEASRTGTDSRMRRAEDHEGDVAGASRADGVAVAAKFSERGNVLELFDSG
jgi:hypothetical protein